MGCLGKGCLILTCFIIFLIIAGAIGLYFGFKTHSAVLRSVLWAKKTHVLSQEASPAPQFETTEESVRTAKQKWEDFESTRDQPAHIELTADDLNNLIANNRHAHGKVFVAIDGNRLHIQTSVPLGEYVWRGRYYLNGDIEIQSDGPADAGKPAAAAASPLTTSRYRRTCLTGNIVPGHCGNTLANTEQLTVRARSKFATAR